MLSALAQEGRLPLHFAVGTGARLDVVVALLKARPEAVQVADEVCERAAWETVGLWTCV